MTTIHHLALPEDWAVAQATGEYRVSTRGVTVEDEGFIHASTPEQVDTTFDRYYADRPDVLLLTIETDLLTSPWRFDDVSDTGSDVPESGTVSDVPESGTAPHVPESGTVFPHVYGPINLDAVVAVAPFSSTGRQS